MKFIGKESTRVAPELGGEKVDVEPDETVEVSKERAKQLVESYRRVWVPADASQTGKKEMKVEGGMNEAKIEKGSTKKK